MLRKIRAFVLQNRSKKTENSSFAEQSNLDFNILLEAKYQVMKSLVVIPTYNEIENIGAIARQFSLDSGRYSRGG